MKLFFGDKQLNENSILKCTEVTQMKKHSAVEIAEDILKIEPDCNKAMRLLAQAVIDAEKSMRHAYSQKEVCNCLPRWLNEYTGEE